MAVSCGVGRRKKDKKDTHMRAHTHSQSTRFPILHSLLSGFGCCSFLTSLEHLTSFSPTFLTFFCSSEHIISSNHPLTFLTAPSQCHAQAHPSGPLRSQGFSFSFCPRVYQISLPRHLLGASKRNKTQTEQNVDFLEKSLTFPPASHDTVTPNHPIQKFTSKLGLWTLLSHHGQRDLSVLAIQCGSPTRSTDTDWEFVRSVAP